jgi:hypothetical protein
MNKQYIHTVHYNNSYIRETKREEERGREIADDDAVVTALFV